MTFDHMQDVSTRAHATMIEICSMFALNGADVVVMEIPCFTQSAKSAFMIGALWGALKSCNHLNDSNTVIVEPSFIKQWSGSKKGDGKAEVLAKVQSRTMLHKNMMNNNIVDAIAIGFSFSDLIRNKYETTR